MKKKNKKKIENLRRQIAHERHERIVTDLMYERAVDDLIARPPMGFKISKRT